MANLLRIFFAFFVFTGVTVHRADAFLRKYVSMIVELHEVYKTSSVCFILPRKDRSNLSENTLVQAVSREFSRRKVLSSIANSEGLNKRMRKCKNSMVRPLIVVVLTTIEEVDEFAVEFRAMGDSFPIWLLIFANASNPLVCNFCENPTGNTFGLRFDTEMLVSCCDESSLKEWWTINGNETRTVLFGEWTIQDGLKMKTKESLYARRPSIKGVPLRIAYVKNSAFRVRSEGKSFGGFFDALFVELKRVMNFEITKVLEAGGFGSWSPVTKTWTGAVELINNGEADLGVAEFSMTTHRLDVVDYTLPFMMSELQLYIKARDSSGVQWSAHFKAFAYQVWVTIIVLVVGTTLLVAMMKRPELDSFPYVIFEHYLYVWGIFCQQGLAVFPSETSLRIAYSSIFVSALVVSAAYSASLISFITVSTTTLPFSSLLEFANDGSYRLVVLQNSSDWNVFDSSIDPVMIKMKKLMKPSNELPQSMTEGFKQICTEKVAFFTSEVMAKTSHKYFPCKVGQIDTGTIDSLAMILPTKSQFTGIVNYHIQRFQDNGMINRLKEKYLRSPSEPETLPNEVTLWGVAPILSVLAAGIILSLILLSCENFYKPRPRLVRKSLLMKNSNGFLTRRIRKRIFSRNLYGNQWTTYLP